MQYVDDDMDELFRKAAEEYPLNTNSADWNAVLKKLSPEDDEKAIVITENKNNYKRLLLLLLLLPLGWMIKYFYSSPGAKKTANTSAANIIPAKDVSGQTASNTNKTLQIHTPIAVQRTAASNIVQFNKAGVVYQQKPKLQQKHFIQYTNKNTTRAASLASNDVVNKREETANNNTNTIADKKDEPDVKKDKATTIVTENLIASEPAETKPDSNASKPSAKIKKKNKEHGLYAGVIAGIDVSTVKYQTINHAGTTAGFLIGYQFNKKISVESGATFDKKYYYSDGKYFNPKNVTLPSYSQIKTLDGDCEMIEIPVTVKYNFKSTQRSNLSVSAGMSSYIMKHESYTYTIDRYGTQYPKDASYNNSSTNFLAVADVSFGYAHRLGKNAQIRLEPYIKIPVNKVGIGSLPIMSGGINIAIIKKLFK